MDQVKQVLAVLKKQHFWVLSGILIIVGLGAWYSAVGKLATQYQERETKLNTQRKAVQEITKSPDPPNQSVIDAIDEAHKKLKDEVYRAWTFLYGVQKESNPWPQVLGEEFIEAAEALKPGENYLKAGEEFKYPKYLEWYQNFINQYLPRLGLIVDVREPKSYREERVKPRTSRRPVVKKKVEKKKPGESASDAEKKAAEESAEEEIVGKVIWDENNELAIRQQFEWETRPTTLQVLIAQENLWVYEALLRIIRDTNEGSASYYKAPVKRIFSLEIGREAANAFASNRGMGGMGGMMGMYGAGGPMGMSGTPGMGGMSTMYGAGGPMGMPGGESAMASSSAAGPAGGPGAGAEAFSPQEMIARSLLDGRYVDQKGQPLSYGSEPPFPQFKMMPVRMMLLVDQRRIPRLLAQCANSSMPVEVKRVILRPDQVQQLNLGGPSASGGAGMMPGMGATMPGMAAPGGMMGPMGPAGGTGEAPMYGGAKSGAMPASSMMKGRSRASAGPSGMPTVGIGMPGAVSGNEDESPWDMQVEIQGIIYIFNPPDRSKFDIGEAAAAGPGAAPAPGAQPAGAAVPAAPGGESAAPARPVAPVTTPAAPGSEPAAPGKTATPTPATPGAPGAGGPATENTAPSGAGTTPVAPGPAPAPAPGGAPEAPGNPPAAPAKT